MPYSVELNDIGIFLGKGLTGPDFLQMVKDQVDQLAEDAADGSGRVMALALPPFVTGQAFRAKYLDQALEYVVNHPGVWTHHLRRHRRSLPGDGGGEAVRRRRTDPAQPIRRDPI